MIVEKAYAKVNLTLEVLDTRSDGFHPVNTIMVPVDLYDELTFSEADEIIYRPSYDIDDDIVVILDHLEDPHNLGAIIRTCEVAGIRNIIIPKDRSVSVNETVMKTSAGALNHINLIMVTNLTETMKKLKKDGFWFVGMDMSGDNYKKIDYTGKIGLVVGSEGFGMSKLVEQNCDFIATIPMRGKVNSLNASVAAGIIIFEAMSQRCD